MFLRTLKHVRGEQTRSRGHIGSHTQLLLVQVYKPADTLVPPDSWYAPSDPSAPSEVSVLTHAKKNIGHAGRESTDEAEIWKSWTVIGWSLKWTDSKGFLTSSTSELWKWQQQLFRPEITFGSSSWTLNYSLILWSHWWGWSSPAEPHRGQKVRCCCKRHSQFSPEYYEGKSRRSFLRKKGMFYRLIAIF